jgi:hypothetical protein
MPATATVAAPLFDRLQPLGSVTVTTLLEVEPVAPAPQPLIPAPPKVTAGEAGSPEAQPLSNVTVIVSPAPSKPVADAVKPAVHVDRAPAFVRVPLKVTAVGVVAALITTLDAGLLSAMSAVVCTLKFAAV